MRHKLLAAALLMLGASSPSLAAAHGPFGLGLALIGPTGISANYYYEKQQSFDAALGWGSSHLHFHADHLWHRRDIIVIDRTPIDVHFGVGARYYRHEKRNGDDDTEIGVRFPVGVSYIFQKVPIQLFGELAPVLVVMDGSALVIDVALGGRYYF